MTQANVHTHALGTSAHFDHRRRGRAPDGGSDEPDSSEDEVNDLDVDHPFWHKGVHKSCPRKHVNSGGYPGNHSGPKPHHATAPPNAVLHRGVPDDIPAVHLARHSASNAAGPRQPMNKPPNSPRNPGHHHPGPNCPVPLMAIQTRPPTPQRPENRCQLRLGHGHMAVTCRSKDYLCYKCSQYGHPSRACISA